MQIRADDPTRPWDEPGVYRVASGVHRIPLPMLNDHLRAVNVYAVDDGEHLTLVDSGIAEPTSRRALEEGLAALEVGLADVSRFLVTHIHHDHFSQAITVRDEFGTDVAVGREEKPSLDYLDQVVRTPGRRPFDDKLDLLRTYGAADLADEIRRSREGDEHEIITGMADHWVEDGAELAVGERTLTALHTPGHTRGHVVFADRDADLLFSGDHILPHITPSIGFEPVSSELPLGDFLRSLHKVREEPDAIMLPAHGPTGSSVHGRVAELLDHHRDRLQASVDAVDAGTSTAGEVAGRLPWTRRGRAFDELSAFNQMLAVLETGAHLDLLVAEGQLTSETVEGVHRYATV